MWEIHEGDDVVILTDEGYVQGAFCHPVDDWDWPDPPRVPDCGGILSNERVLDMRDIPEEMVRLKAPVGSILNGRRVTKFEDGYLYTSPLWSA